MPECCNPTCLSVLYTGGGGGKAAPGKFNICICLTTSQPPLMRNGVSVAGWSSGAQGVQDEARLSRQTSQHSAETFMRLPAWRRWDRGPCLNWTPSRSFTSGSVTTALAEPISHQLRSSVGLCRYWPLTSSLLGGSGIHAEVLFKLRGLALQRQRWGLPFATRVAGGKIFLTIKTKLF